LRLIGASMVSAGETNARPAVDRAEGPTEIRSSTNRRKLNFRADRSAQIACQRIANGSDRCKLTIGNCGGGRTVARSKCQRPATATATVLGEGYGDGLRRRLRSRRRRRLTATATATADGYGLRSADGDGRMNGSATGYGYGDGYGDGGRLIFTDAFRTS